MYMFHNCCHAVRYYYLKILQLDMLDLTSSAIYNYMHKFKSLMNFWDLP